MNGKTPPLLLGSFLVLKKVHTGGSIYRDVDLLPVPVSKK